MNNIRNNADEEVEIIKARFKMPLLGHLLFAFFVLNLGLYCYHFFHNVPALLVGLIGLIAVGSMWAFANSVIQRSSCTVTNKRIYGQKGNFLFLKAFSYRLDEIDSVKVNSFLGMNSMTLVFSPGHISQTTVVNAEEGGVISPNAFVITNLADAQEIYGKCNDLLCRVKNDKDVNADIELLKIEAENRKAEAVETLIKGVLVNPAPAEEDYITEIKRLKELLDQNVITQKEFEEK